MPPSLLRTERARAVTALVVPLLLIAGAEAFNAIKQAPGLGVAQGFLAGLLVFSALASLCLLASLAPGRRYLRAAWLVAVYMLLAGTGSALLFSWLAFWITERPMNADVLRILVGSPLGSVLHLLSTAPVALVGILVALVACLYGLLRLLRASTRLSGLVPATARLLLLLAVGALTFFAARLVANADRSRSSYAALIKHGTSATGTVRYGCPVSADVPLAAPEASQSNRAPIIVLMMESLRSDLMTTYAAAMPNLAQLAKESVVFERAYATSSHSDYADLSFWYSRHPLRAERRLGYPPDAPWRGISVFEYFKLHGYTTAYFSSQNEKWGDMINWLKIPAVDTFFDSESFTGETWENPDDANGLIALIRAGIARSGKVEDSHTLRLSGDWIDKHANDAFFIGLNLQNTHYHYFIPEGGERPYQPDRLGFRTVYSAWPADQAPVVRNRYLNAAYNMDAAIGQFIDRLKLAGVWDKAIVLAIGDGGEAFYEHGFGNHSGPMYEEVARTLAILKLPKGDPRNGTRSDVPVSHIDFVPALLDAAGMNAWPGFQGMAPWRQPRATPVFMTVNAITVEDAVLDWPWKLMVRTFPAHSVELYDLKQDPQERSNETTQRSDIVERLLQKLTQFRECQLGYYADANAYERIQPPRFQAQQTSATQDAAAATR